MNKNLDLENFFPYQFSILAQKMSEYIAQIYRQEYGLSRFEWRVLAAIAQSPKVTAKDIICITRLDKMQVSRAIAKLSNNQLLIQQVSTVDRRSTTLSLNNTGVLLYEEIVPKVQQQEENLLSHLSVQEREIFITLTKKMNQQLQLD